MSYQVPSGPYGGPAPPPPGGKKPAFAPPPPPRESAYAEPPAARSTPELTYGKLPSAPPADFDPTEHVLFSTKVAKPSMPAPPPPRSAAPPPPPTTAAPPPPSSTKKSGVVDVIYAKLPSAIDETFDPSEHVTTSVQQTRDGKKVKRKKPCVRCEAEPPVAKAQYQEVSVKLCQGCIDAVQADESLMLELVSKVRRATAAKASTTKVCERCAKRPRYAKAEFDGDIMQVCMDCIADHPQFKAILRKALTHIKAKKYDEGRECLLQLSAMIPGHAPTLYNLACVEALDGNAEDGLRALDDALACGYSRYRLVLKDDKDLKALRRLKPGWDDFVAKHSLVEKVAAEDADGDGDGGGGGGRGLLSGMRSLMGSSKGSDSSRDSSSGPVGPVGPAGPPRPSNSGRRSSAAGPIPYATKPYWKPTFDRKMAENFLSGQKPGHFILRPSSQPGALSLSHLKAGGGVGHCFVRVYEEGRKGYAVENETEHYDTVEELIASLTDLNQTLNV